MKIKEFINQVRGVSYKPTDVLDSNSGVPILRANNIDEDGINYNELVYISKDKINDKQYLQKGDIFVCASSGSKNLVGKAGVFDSYDSLVSFGAFCKVVRIKNISTINKDYIRLFFRSKSYRQQISNFSIGANINNIKTENIDDLRINIPNIDKQNEAVSILNSLISALKIKNNELLSLDDLIKSRFIEMFGDPNLNDKSFNQLSIKDIGKCVAGATPSTKIKEYWDNGTISWLSSGEVNKQRIFETDSKITELGYDHASTKMVPAHTVVLAMAGQGKTRGTVAMAEIPLCTNQSICSIVNNNKVNPEYLLEYLKLQYDELRRVSNGGEGRGGLNLKIIGNFPIIVPPIELQNDYSEFVTQIDKSKFT